MKQINSESACATLKVDDIPILELSGDVPATIVSLFSDADLHSYQSAVATWNLRSEQLIKMQRYTFNITVKDAGSRLNVMGFTVERTKEAFDAGIALRYETLRSWYEDDGHEEGHQLRKLTFDDYRSYVRALCASGNAHVDTSPSLPSSWAANFIGAEFGEEYLLAFPHTDPRWALRALLEQCEPEQTITLDVSDLVDNEYIDDVACYCSQKRKAAAMDAGRSSPIIVLTEGSSDSMILRKALELLYPELVEYFSFLDFSYLKLQGGAPELVKTIKSFATAGIANRVIAVFDNDSAAHEALSSLETNKLPANIRVLFYPENSMASHYPTIGPSGEIQMMNVNGSAASLELYFGRKILVDSQGNLRPIRWNGYVPKLKRYQGEVEDKTELQKNYAAFLEGLKTSKPSIIHAELADMKTIIDALLNAFI